MQRWVLVASLRLLFSGPLVWGPRTQTTGTQATHEAPHRTVHPFAFCADLQLATPEPREVYVSTYVVHGMPGRPLHE
jgi:hypothetical protein